MEDKTDQRKMLRMMMLFYFFVSAIPLGIFLAVATPVQWFGVGLALAGGASGVVCAFTSCPCCGELSGVFFRSFYGGAFPIGKCMHCNSSYINAKGCGSDS